jgi:Flp pilus assembly protein TadD
MTRWLRRSGPLAVGVAAGAFVAGCASSPRPPHSSSPYTTPSEASRDTVAAQRLHQEAARLMESDPARAERLLREALAADIFFGPAHNNLGVLFLSRGQLFEAASEFEWACKLMPGQPDPRVNLALTLESAGRTEGALDAYATALEVSPGYLPAIQGLASLQLRTGQADHRTPDLLEQIAMRGDETWRHWAVGHMQRGR